MLWRALFRGLPPLCMPKAEDTGLVTPELLLLLSAMMQTCDVGAMGGVGDVEKRKSGSEVGKSRDERELGAL